MMMSLNNVRRRNQAVPLIFTRALLQWKHTTVAVQMALAPTTNALLTQDEITCFRILETRRKREVAYIRHVSALRKHGDLVFHGRDAFPSCFRVGNERSCFRHISVITFPFFLVSVTFQVTNFFLFFLTHVQDRMINVS